MAGEVTQLTPQGVGVYFEIPDKIDSGAVDVSSVDSIVLFLDEGTTGQETEVYDYPRLILAEVSNVVVIPPIPNDDIRLILSDVAFPPTIVGAPVARTGSDAIVLVLAESADVIEEPLEAEDDILLVLDDASEAPVDVAPTDITGEDDILFVLNDDNFLIDPFLPFAEVDASDSIVLVLSTDEVARDYSGDVDRMTFTSKPFGYITFTPI
jgi:hypothetical protein